MVRHIYFEYCYANPFLPILIPQNYNNYLSTFHLFCIKYQLELCTENQIICIYHFVTFLNYPHTNANSSSHSILCPYGIFKWTIINNPYRAIKYDFIYFFSQSSIQQVTYFCFMWALRWDIMGKRMQISHYILGLMHVSIEIQMNRFSY